MRWLTPWLALCGVVGPLVFVVAFTVAGFTRPGYSQIHQAISDLGVGPKAWLLNVPLVALGPLLAAFAVGFFQILGPALGDPWRWICAVLVLLPGLGYALAGIFTEATGVLHWVGANVLITIGSLAGFSVTGLRLRRLPEWRAWGTYSIIASVATLILIAAEFALWPTGMGGLLERLLFVELLAWYVVIGGWLFREGTAAMSRRDQ